MPGTDSHEKWIDLTNARTRYLEAGTGDRHLILLHGMGISSSADSYRFVLEDLGEKYHVCSLDMLGFGKGTRTIREGPTFDLVVDHIREFMDAKEMESTSIVGHSAGGWMAALLAYESPERLDKLVMLCSAGMNATPASGIGATPQPSRESALAGARQSFGAHAEGREEEIKEMAELSFSMTQQPGALESLDPLVHQMATPELRQRYLLHRRLGKIKVPSLVVWGELDTMDPYPTWTKEYHELNGDMSKSSKPWVIPDAKYVLLPTDHSPQVERPAEMVALLTEFLDQ